MGLLCETIGELGRWIAMAQVGVPFPPDAASVRGVLPVARFGTTADRCSYRRTGEFAWECARIHDRASGFELKSVRAYLLSQSGP